MPEGVFLNWFVILNEVKNPVAERVSVWPRRYRHGYASLDSSLRSK
jgi:hypothetical protein